MAIARVQEVSSYAGAASTTHTVPVTNAPAAGNKLIIILLCAGNRNFGVSDSAGNTWTKRSEANGGTSQSCEIYETEQDVADLTTSDDITVTISASIGLGAKVYEYSGGAASWFDVGAQTGNGASGVTAFDSGATATPAQATGYVLGVATFANTPGTITETAPWDTATLVSSLWGPPDFARKAFVYERQLTAADAQQFAGTYTSARQNTAHVLVFKDAGGGGDTALAGSSAGASTAAGDLTTQIALAGSAAGAASAVAALTTAIQLAGSAAGAATADGDLTTQIALVGLSAGAATADGDLTTQIALAGSSAGVATAEGVLGDSEVADTALAGSSAGTSSAAGVLTTEIHLAGTSAGLAAVSGDLTTVIALAGSSAGLSSAAAALTTAIALAGSSAGVASAQADLTTAIRLAGSSAGIATAVAVLGSVAIPGRSAAVLALVAAPTATAAAVAIPAAVAAMVETTGAAVAVVPIGSGVVALVAIPSAEVS